MTTRPVESAAPARRPVQRSSMVVEKGVILTVRITSDLKGMIDAAAKKSGLTSADWTRAVLARAANEGAFAPRKGGPHGPRSRKAGT
jgi:hypothetical protein